MLAQIDTAPSPATDILAAIENRYLMEEFEGAGKEKEDAGFTVLVARPFELFLDLDGGLQSKAIFVQRLLDLNRDGFGHPTGIQMWQSKSPGHLHVVITLRDAIPDAAFRIALQMYLGSDPKGALAQLHRLARGVDKIRLFRPPNATIHSFNADDFIAGK